MNTTQPMQTEDGLRVFTTMVFARRELILFVTSLVFISAFLIAFLYPPTYAAYSTILIRGKEPEKDLRALERIDVRRFPVTEMDLFSEVEMLKSPEIIFRTLEQLRILPENQRGSEKSLKRLHQVRKNLKTEVIPGSKVVRVTLLGNDPTFLVPMLDALVQQYIMYRTQLQNPGNVAPFLQQQAARFERSIQQRESDIIELAEQSGTPVPATEIATNVLLKQELQRTRNQLKQKFIEGQGRIEHLEAALDESKLQFFSSIENKAINKLTEKLIELSVERSELARTYSQDSSTITRLDKQVDKRYAELRNEVSAFTRSVKSDLQITRQKIIDVNSEIAQIESRNIELHRQEIEAGRIGRESNIQERSYDTFARRREEAHIDGTFDVARLSSYVSVLTTAFPTNGPIFPRKAVVLPLGVFLGLLLGLTVALIREFFDHTFRTAADIEQHTNLQLLFSIPELDAEKKPVDAILANRFMFFIIAALVVVALATSVALLLGDPEDPFEPMPTLSQAAGGHGEAGNEPARKGRD